MALPNKSTIGFCIGLAVASVTSFSPLVPTRTGELSPLRQTENPRSRNLGYIQDYQQSPQLGIFPKSNNWREHVVLRMSSTAPAAEDSQKVNELFSKYCDQDSLIDKKTLLSMPPFSEMLADEDILLDELNEIWDAASKASADPTRVGMDSFVQIYRDVDDLFEDDEEENTIEEDIGITENIVAQVRPSDVGMDQDLSKSYRSLCDSNGLISKDKLKQWDEIESLLQEGLLGEDEFEELWTNTRNDDSDSVDASGFEAFNSLLDDLFVLDEEEDGSENERQNQSPNMPSREMVIEGDMSPDVLFSELADRDFLVGKAELNLWTELDDLLQEGELMESELQTIFEKYATAEGKLTKDAFLKLYQEIDALFESDDVTSDTKVGNPIPSSVMKESDPQNKTISKKVKDDLLSYIAIVVNEDNEPCGFGVSDPDHGQVLNILNILEKQPTNLLLQKEIEQSDLSGVWELVYTSSSAMKFNKGLSGIGGSFPNGKFGGLRQELKATKFLSDMEYKERIDVNPSGASFDVTINGIWDLQKSVSLFSGQPTVILNVIPDRVSYGPTSTRADHWKSLGPVNRLDLSYLDDDLRVMRGCTSSDTLFVFKKLD